MNISARVPARAAVAGNPSDGFDGAVCSVIVPFFEARAQIVEGDGDQMELVTATVERFGSEVEHCGDVGVSIETSIPRSVGLAGSSAIVIATIRVLDSLKGTQLTALQIATLAHTIERVDLGIAGGWQDQIIQSHGVSGLMEFAGSPRIEPIAMPADNPIPLYLAWSPRAAEASGDAHAALREERGAGDVEMRRLADIGRNAARALVDRDVHALKAAINETFDIRRTIMAIAPAQEEMVETARSLGASANFAGSGGAILGVLPKHPDQFLTGMRDAGHDVASWSAT